MFFSLIFFAFAVLFVWAGRYFWLSPGPGSVLVSLVFYQAAAAEVVTGLLYFFNSIFEINAGPLFKTTRGRVNLLPRVFAWPYLVFEFMTWRRYRQRAREPLFERVVDGLFLGARIIEEDLPTLEAAGIDTVVDMVAEFEDPPAWRADPRKIYVAIPALDGTAPSLRELELGTRLIVKAMETGRRVLVHCTFGHGRSATMATAVLLARGEAESPKQALKILSGLKRKIWLSSEQKRVLGRFRRQQRPD